MTGIDSRVSRRGNRAVFRRVVLRKDERSVPGGETPYDPRQLNLLYAEREAGKGRCPGCLSRHTQASEEVKTAKTSTPFL
jgi:hypothetical protein